MQARAIYKAVISFDSIEIPVRFYSAVRDQTVHFRLLHSKDGVPVEQRMVNPATGEPVAHSEMLRGFPLEGGTYVVLTDEELSELEPEATRVIEIPRVVDPQQISHQFYDRPYFLGPDGNDEAYFALARTLSDLGKDAIARWVMRKHRYAGVLRAHGDYLALISLRHAQEVVLSSELPMPTGRALRDDERRMAEQLVGMYTGEFDPQQYRDEYRERVLSLVEAKAKGRKVHLVRAHTPKREASLTAALKASLNAAHKRRKVA